MITDSIYYYDKDRNIYTNQINALNCGKQCWFYFYDKELTVVDWKREPNESLDVLYRKRAEYIRDTHKYVILCYSGGHDSTNILETFYYNKIHIDEILIVGAFGQDSFSGSDENHNGELYKNAFPTLKLLDLPNTKISIVDYTKWFNDPMTNFTMLKKYGDEWTKYIGGFRSVHTLFWHDIKKFVGHHNSKDTAYIMGTDKIRVNVDESNHSYVYFSDISFFDYGSNYLDENFKRVNFYNDSHETAINIMRKQAHMVSFCKKIDGYTKVSDYEDFLYVNKIIYNLKHPLVYMSPKSISSSVSERDKFMLNSKSSDMFSIFLDGLNNVRKANISTKQLYMINSKPHYID